MARQLHGQDTLFLHLDSPNAHMGVTMVYFYDQSSAPGGKIRFKQILQHIDSRLGDSPIFGKRLERLPFDLDNPYWVDDEYFDVEFHVRHQALPKPGDWRQLSIQLARFHARPLDLTRPLWEMCVIEGLDNVEGLPEGSFAVATKVHHAVLDGHTGVELTWNLHDTSPEIPEPVTRKPRAIERAPNFFGKLTRMAYNNVTEPLRLIKPLTKALPQLSSTAISHYWKQFTDNDQRRPKTRFQNDISTHRVWDLATFDFKAFSQIKNTQAKASINDVVLTIIAGALRYYLNEKGELPKQSLRALAPINVRAENEYEMAGNQVSMFFPDLPVEIADPMKRLEAVIISTSHSKELSNAIGAREMADIGKHTPPLTLALASRLTALTGLDSKVINSVGETVVTNVPGPQQPLYMLGAKMVNFTGLGPIANGMGLLHAITSYDKKMNISFTACREIMPDPAFYKECIERSFTELAEACTSLKPAESRQKSKRKPKGNIPTAKNKVAEAQ